VCHRTAVRAEPASGQFFIDGDAGLHLFGGFGNLVFRPGDDWLFEAGIVDQDASVQLSFKVWKLGDAEPAQPQLIVVDDTPLPPNYFQLGGWVPQAGSLTDVTFDDVHFRAIPEPSSWFGALSGLLYLCRGRCRAFSR
jgi:hypothetical protein